MKRSHLTILLLVLITVSSCSERLDYGHRNSYWVRRNPRDHKGDRYTHMKYQRERRGLFSSHGF